MAPTNKARAAGVSASSFFDLKAELAKKEEEVAKNRAAGKHTLVGGVKRPDKKPTVWARTNKGVHKRAARDIELEVISKPTLESARAILERKAQIYDKLRKGKSGGLNEAQYSELLVDFDSKPLEDYEEDSDDVDESLMVPQRPEDDEDDPIIDYEDEFGRARTGRRSEIPRHLLKEEEEEEEIDPFVIYNPEAYFPTYQPSEERLAAIKEKYSDENNPLNVHYDASREVRAKGGAFYQFSGDEETRKRQMDEFQKARDETEKMRQETGAVNVSPGDVEGMIARPAVADGVPKSKALEKRRRDIEERRKQIDAKRRKKNTDASSHGPTPVPRPSSSPSPHLSDPVVPQQSSSAMTGLNSTSSSVAALDPFALLESQLMASDKGKGKAVSSLNSADAFLANLEQDIMNGMNR